jgi:hypothetical protein
MTKPVRINHTLLGCRVLYKGKRYWITGARKSETGLSFRIFQARTKKERWTEPYPNFSEIHWPLETPLGSEKVAMQKRFMDKTPC